MTVIALAEIADQIRGVSYAKADVVDRPAEGFLPVLRANNITDDGLSFDDLVYVRAEKVSAKQQVRSGDIVIAASSGSISVVGKAAQAEHDLGMGFGAFCKVVRPSPKVHARYIGHFFKTRDYRRRMSALAAGANINNLKNEHIDEIEIPLPTLDEQKRIAGILDQADELRRKRQRAIDRLNQLGQAIFHEMFGDPVTNPKGFLIKKLGEVGILDRGVSKHRPRNDPALLGGEHPLIQTGDVANADGYIRNFTSTYSDLGLKQSRKWPSGTLCITIAANIGKTAILNIDACFPDSVVGFTPGTDTNAEYVQFWMSRVQKRLEEIAPQSAQKNINLAILRELPIPMPARALQDEFQKLIGVIETRKATFRAAEEGSEALFSSLQHRAFQGEL
ncbi:restriction endonuclease subunit S [Porphyrobacter algicida]|uniref:Restriction endonuclease subunit S n=1 Tax=Qipengyuania algicida TaxID=1836209 RepID=A0A845AJV6_9SPHN|nr:restriction endonuclease subunit S [Qipengyuania algicida]MXP29697.1 restriction endonuclease subunit S [Qipengyuania algicida]